MIHLTNKAEEICKTLRKQGFKGIRFTGVEMQYNLLEDFDGDVAAFEARNRDSAYFNAFPIYPVFDIDEDEYTEAPSFNESKFEKDLTDWVREQMGGDDVTVHYRNGCGEFECVRIKNAE